MRVERKGSELAFSVIPGVSFPWALFLFGSIAVLAHLALGVIVLLSPVQNLESRLLAWLCAVLACELAMPEQVSTLVLDPALQTLGYTLLFGFEMALSIHLVARVPAPHPLMGRGGRWAVPAIYTLALGWSAVDALTFALEQVGQRLPWTAEQIWSIGGSFVEPAWTVVLIGLLGVQAARFPQPRGRHQAGLMLAGFLPVAILVWWRLSAEAVGLAVPAWVDWGRNLASLCLPLAAFLAILLYRLFGIEVVVQRRLIYNLLTGNLLFFGFLVLGGIGAFTVGRIDHPESVLWLGFGLALLLGSSFSPLRDNLERTVERRFFPERLHLRQQVTKLVAELPRSADPQAVGRAVVARLAAIFQVSPVTLLLTDRRYGNLYRAASTVSEGLDEIDHSFLLPADDLGREQLLDTREPIPVEALAPLSAGLALRLEASKARLVVPLVEPGELVGLLLMGEKQDGRAFQPEEIDLLALLGHHLTASLENSRLAEFARLESLTGLMRREAILELLKLELERAIRYRRPLAVAMLDLDRFKLVNDLYGHLAGDNILRSVGRLLTEQLRSSDALGRYGGEEFLLVMPETGLGSAREAAEKLRRSIEAAELPVEGETPLRKTVSIGVAAFEPAEDASPLSLRLSVLDLIDVADRCLYRAKHDGRNRVEAAPVEVGRRPNLQVVGEGSRRFGVF